MKKRDLLDIGQPGEKEWQEFRAHFAAALLLKWLVADLDVLRPNYADELWKRLQSAGEDFDKALDLERHDDDVLPVTGPDWPEDMNVSLWITRRELEELITTLFPHGRKETNLADAARGAVLVGLHSALELYARACGAHRNGQLPENIQTFLRTHGRAADLDSDTYEALKLADATRHLVVHQGGIVDEKYRIHTRNERLLPGERRRVREEELDRWSAALLRVADMLRRASRPRPAV